MYAVYRCQAMSSPSPPAPVTELQTIADEFNGIDRVSDRVLGHLPSMQLPSAMNLLHYLVLRSHDLRDTQRALATDGLSSLGRMESHVQSSLHAVLRSLHLLAGVEPPAAPERVPLTVDDGEALLTRHTDELFGPSPDGRSVRIMVTTPTEAATDYELVRDLLAAGMDCMRINCAHDGPQEWLQMIDHLKRATAETGRPCRVCMDVGGPKLRTCAIEPGPAVQKLKPARDAWGRVTFPAIVCIVPAYVDEGDRVAADAELVIDGPPPASLMPGDWIHFIDARGRRRRLRVMERRGDSVLTTLDRTAYVVPGTELRMPSATEGDLRRVAEVPLREQSLTLQVGDVLVLTPEGVPGCPAIRDNNGSVIVPAQVGVSLAEIFRDARPGEAIWFDDGRIGGRIEAVEPDRARIRITHTGPGGGKLRSDKGINLPETNLRLGALTGKDLEDLRFIVQHADLIGYSFVRCADDVRQLQMHLNRLGGEHLGIILKIETRGAFEELPRLLLASMRTGRFGVMIARGDLAIECGYERMAEVQEEILWISEAAHAPVIWATQVLENLAKTGVPSRAEVTDAAMSERAECVMLNKGPYVRQAVRTLDDILRRMQAHQTKKRAMLRPLHVAESVVREFTGAAAGVGAPPDLALARHPTDVPA